jgi:hypothetical protein
VLLKTEVPLSQVFFVGLMVSQTSRELAITISPRGL